MKLEFLEAGEIVTTHGVRGEVKVLPWADSPEFLLDYNRVIVGTVEYKVEQCRIQKTCNLVKLAGVDSMEVFCDGNCIGTIADVLDYPGNKVYVVRGDYEYMIPAVKEFVLSTSLQDNKMLVRLIEGMRTDES